MRRVVCATAAALLCIATALQGQGIRDRTRPEQPPDTEVSEAQAVDLTLTLVDTARTALQTWVRTAATLDDEGRNLTACVLGPDADLVTPGQRVRAFPPDSKSSIYQARVSRVEPGETCVTVEAALSGPTYERAPRYVMEIVVERGMYLAIPNEAIIEEGDRQVVYKEDMPGSYVPMDIQTGLIGELYAEVLEGLVAGDRVVTFGSFFIDAEHKLKASGAGGMPGMPGMSGMSGMSEEPDTDRMDGESTAGAMSGMPGTSDDDAAQDGAQDGAMNAHDDH